MAAKLKVFAWSDGFHRFTVAASSRPKALQAWGIKADIFKSGLAEESPDGPDAEAALKSPGEVIERGLSVDIGQARAKKPKKAGPSAAARKTVQTLEADLEALDQAHEEARAEMDARRAGLDKAAAALDADHDEARSALVKRLKAARAKL